ncbi:MAG TPA: cobalamin biosynthesis protein [Candidatus Acidoferrum sp.]|nr:cobalamin biosynthesis protein [Candidatus Acidoferrum sp.]
MSATRAIGIGFSSDASVEDVLALLRAVAGTPERGTCLATLDRRAAIAREVAVVLGLQLLTFPAEVLVQVKAIVTPSPRAAERVGTPSVAEAAALLAAGPGARIVIPRRTGTRCTCALAESP